MLGGCWGGAVVIKWTDVGNQETSDWREGNKRLQTSAERILLWTHCERQLKNRNLVAVGSPMQTQCEHLPACLGGSNHWRYSVRIPNRSSCTTMQVQGHLNERQREKAHMHPDESLGQEAQALCNDLYVTLVYTVATLRPLGNTGRASSEAGEDE